MDLSSGNARAAATDFILDSTSGVRWFHHRNYSSQVDRLGSIEGCNWQSGYAATVEFSSPTLSFKFDQETVLRFTQNGSVYEPPEENGRYAATQSGSDYVLTTPGFYRLYFYGFSHNPEVERGKLANIWDNYGRGIELHYDSSGRLEYVDDADDHRARYSYVPSGTALEGMLNYITIFKSISEGDSNLIGKIAFTYHDGDSGDAGGELKDLLKVEVSRKATGDGDGTLSIVERTHYRYWEGTFNGSTNPGTDHKLKMIIRAGNYERLDAAEDNPLAVSDATADDYADVQYEYAYLDTEDADDPAVADTYFVDKTVELGKGCGCGGGATGVTTYDWDPVGTGTTYDSIKRHVKVTLASGTSLYVDTNLLGDTLTWVYESGSDYWRYHFDYGEPDDPDAVQILASFGPETVTGYSTTSPYGVTLSETAGVVRVFDYSWGNGDKGMLISRGIKTGSSGATITHLVNFEYAGPNGSTMLALTQVGPDGVQATTPDKNTKYSYTYWDTNQHMVKEIIVDAPKVTTSQNGPGVRAVSKQWYDSKGLLRWTLDPEGQVNYYGYDDGDGASGDKTGQPDLVIEDVDTSAIGTSALTLLDADWDGSANGLAGDDYAPYARSAPGTALNFIRTSTIDALGRVVKTVEPDGKVSHRVYLNNETRSYPIWDSSSSKTALPTTIVTRSPSTGIVEVKQVKNDVVFNATSGAPNGSETISRSDLVGLTINEYDRGGRLIAGKEYHSIPSSGDTAYTHYYETVYKYDNAGRKEYVIEPIVIGHAKPASLGRVKTGHFEEEVRCGSLSGQVSGWRPCEWRIGSRWSRYIRFYP